jgi:hypothetical protein
MRLFKQCMARYSGTKTPLTGAGTVTLDLGAGRDDWVVGMVFADQAGNIFIEQSMDGTNWDLSTTYAVSANDGKGFKEEIFAPYVRVRYVNGATPQTVFRLTARFSSAGPR